MQRSDTRSITTFTLPFPDAATFDFAASPAPATPKSIRIAVPPFSTWMMHSHWHPSERNVPNSTPAACQSVTSVSGPLFIYMGSGLGLGWNLSGGTGTHKTFTPGLWVAWQRLDYKASIPLTVDFVADHTLWRNICSATLDKAIFPRLASTPFWLKNLFALLTFVPTWRERLLNVMLWTQLQTIFFAHDFHLYHGFIRFSWPWTSSQPFGGRAPAWVERLDYASLYIISRVVMTSAYWIGRLFLGMKGEYKEYTPTRSHMD